MTTATPTPDTWTCRDRTVIPIREMGDDHLVRTIRMLRRNHLVRTYAAECLADGLRGEMARDSADSAVREMYDAESEHPAYEAMVAEAKRRGLEV